MLCGSTARIGCATKSQDHFAECVPWKNTDCATKSLELYCTVIIGVDYPEASWPLWCSTDAICRIGIRKET